VSGSSWNVQYCVILLLNLSAGWQALSAVAVVAPAVCLVPLRSRQNQARRNAANVAAKCAFGTVSNPFNCEASCDSNCMGGDRWE
jgi:hypothetical protein